MSYQNYRDPINIRDESEVRKQLKPIFSTAIVLIVFLALGVLLGFNSYTTSQANIKLFIDEFGPNDPNLPLLQGLLPLIVAETVLNAVLLVLMSLGLVLFNKTKKELTSKNLKTLKIVLLINAIGGLAFFIFEVVALTKINATYLEMGMEVPSNFMNYVMQGARFALYIVMFLAAHKAFVALTKLDNQIIDNDYQY